MQPSDYLCSHFITGNRKREGGIYQQIIILYWYLMLNLSCFFMPIFREPEFCKNFIIMNSLHTGF